MPEDINDLLDRCEQRTLVLSQETDRAVEEVSQIVQFATTLTAKLAATSQEAASSFEALSSKLEAAEQNLESELASAKESLSAVQEKSNQVQSQSEEKISQIKSQLTDLKSRKQEMSSDVNQEAETTKASFDKLSQQAQAFETEAGNYLETSRSNLEEFQGSVDGATSSFSDRQRSLMEQFATFEEDFRNKLESLTNDFSTVAQQSDSKLTEVNSSLDTTSSDVLAAISQKFIEEAVAELSDSADQLTTATSTLRDAGEGSSEVLDEKLLGIVDQVDEVVAIIDEIKPILDMVQDVLG